MNINIRNQVYGQCDIGFFGGKQENIFSKNHMSRLQVHPLSEVLERLPKPYQIEKDKTLLEKAARTTEFTADSLVWEVYQLHLNEKRRQPKRLGRTVPADVATDAKDLREKCASRPRSALNNTEDEQKTVESLKTAYRYLDIYCHAIKSGWKHDDKQKDRMEPILSGVLILFSNLLAPVGEDIVQGQGEQCDSEASTDIETYEKRAPPPLSMGCTTQFQGSTGTGPAPSDREQTPSGVSSKDEAPMNEVPKGGPKRIREDSSPPKSASTPPAHKKVNQGGPIMHDVDQSAEPLTESTAAEILTTMSQHPHSDPWTTNTQSLVASSHCASTEVSTSVAKTGGSNDGIQLSFRER